MPRLCQFDGACLTLWSKTTTLDAPVLRADEPRGTQVSSAFDLHVLDEPLHLGEVVGLEGFEIAEVRELRFMGDKLETVT